MVEHRSNKFRMISTLMYLAILLFAVLMILQEVLMIPLYIIFQNLHWIDTHWGLIIPGMANAFGIFFMRPFIQSLPDEMLEDARIDDSITGGIYEIGRAHV